ncbi:FHA domain-containing protein [Prosthecobacter sp.]|uniref:FHA domain-containing protein n=1 Tax=Prosthecobacter sp. TaxID=1965333 RepID=UPI003784C4F8
MNSIAPSPFAPTDSEVAAVGKTVSIIRPDTSPLHTRLAAASRLLSSLPAQPVAASLVFSRGNDLPVEAVPIGDGITVGRGRHESIPIPECLDLSRRHFSVRQESGFWLLEDASSRNGTFVDGVEGRISRRVLRDGDIIFAGDLLFLFVDPAN